MPTDPQSLGQALAAVTDSLSAVFARELARVLQLTERHLLPILKRERLGDRTAKSIARKALPLRTELRTALTKAGYDALVREASISAVERMAGAFRSRGVSLGRITPARLQALASLLEADLMGLGDSAAHSAWRAGVQAIYTERPVDEILAQLSRQLDKSFAQAQTIYDTQVSITGRQIERILSEGDEEQAFLYVGPVDARTREWCLDHVGKVFSRVSIEQLDNGQLPNPFLTAGGWNCRHTFLAVSDPVLVALKDTGQRAEGYDGRVAMARTMKSQRKRFRELRKAA
jgi:hypothetical protein